MSLSNLFVHAQPDWVGAMAVYPNSPILRAKFTIQSHFGDIQTLYREVGDKIFLPRAVCPPPTPETDRRDFGLPVTFDKCNFKPRDQDQARVVSEMIELLQAGESFIMQMPTGGGKTACAMPVIAAIGKVTAIVVHKSDLLNRWRDELTKTLGLLPSEIGLIQGSTMDVGGKKVILCMIQSISKRDRYPSWVSEGVGLVITDECFHPDHELLTDEGWKPVGSVCAGERVMAFDAEFDALMMQPVLHTISKPFYGQLIRIRGPGFDTVTTPNHEQPVRDRGFRTIKRFRVFDVFLDRLNEFPVPCYVTPDLLSMDWVPTSGWSKRAVSYAGDVHCVTVPAGNVLTRLGSVISISGNCHHVGAPVFAQSIEMFPAALRVGLSATPTRKDGLSIVFHAHIGPVRVIGKKAAMVPRVLRVTSSWKCPRRGDGTVIKHAAGKDMHVKKIVAGSNIRNAKLVRAIKASYDAGRTIVVFTHFINHAKLLQTLLVNEGTNILDVHLYLGESKPAERAAALKSRIVITTYTMMKEGTDYPALDTCVLATPISDIEQAVGRILREHPGKKVPAVLDMVDLDSPVFKGYSFARMKWYQKKGCDVMEVDI